MIQQLHDTEDNSSSVERLHDRAIRVPRTIAFDLDETVYPRQAGVMQAIGHRITEYIERFFGVTRPKALALRAEYLRRHGTTLRGLQIHHDIDADEYMAFVHNVPVEQLLRNDPRLDQALSNIDAEKIIFTNASWEHAERVLNAIGIRHHFGRIVDVRDMGWESKPHPGAYSRLLCLLDARPEEVMLVEDNIRNLRPAVELGMLTVLVDAGAEGESIDFIIHEIWQIEDVYRQLRHQQPKSSNSTK